MPIFITRVEHLKKLTQNVLDLAYGKQRWQTLSFCWGLSQSISSQLEQKPIMFCHGLILVLVCQTIKLDMKVLGLFFSVPDKIMCYISVLHMTMSCTVNVYDCTQCVQPLQWWLALRIWSKSFVHNILRAWIFLNLLIRKNFGYLIGHTEE